MPKALHRKRQKAAKLRAAARRINEFNFEEPSIVSPWVDGAVYTWTLPIVGTVTITTDGTIGKAP